MERDYREQRIIKLRNKYQAKLDKWTDEYNQTGIGRERTRYEYEDIILACRLALEALSEVCLKCSRTIRYAHELKFKYRQLEEQGLPVTADMISRDLNGFF